MVLYGSAGVWIWYGWGSRLVRKGVLLWYERVALWDFGFGAYTARSLGRPAGDRLPQLSGRFREWTPPVSTHPAETQFNDVSMIQLFSTDGRRGDVEAAVAFDWPGCAGGAPRNPPAAREAVGAARASAISGSQRFSQIAPLKIRFSF